MALEECCGLGQGFQLAERDMAIRGIGSVFGEKQSGDVGKVGVDLYLEMLFEGLKKVLHSLLFDLSLFHVEVVPMCVELSAMQPDKEKSMKLYGVKLQLWNACP